MKEFELNLEWWNVADSITDSKTGSKCSNVVRTEEIHSTRKFLYGRKFLDFFFFFFKKVCIQGTRINFNPPGS